MIVSRVHKCHGRAIFRELRWYMVLEFAVALSLVSNCTYFHPVGVALAFSLSLAPNCLHPGCSRTRSKAPSSFSTSKAWSNLKEQSR
jgi:hypothetical protein